MKYLISFILFLFGSSFVWAQTEGTLVRGEIFASDGKAIERGEVTLFQNDSLAAAAMTNSKGKFEIRNLPAGNYLCQVSALGYKEKVQSISIKGVRLNVPKIILQKDSTVMLGELTVTADQKLRTKDMAGMTVYQLSAGAKQENNAYTALQEIPRLIINPVMKDIKLDDGSSPLILIDGVNKPGFLSVLRPDMIESVEVIDNPSARYRANSKVTSVLNIRLKSKVGMKPYLNGYLGVNLMPNFRFGVEDISAEIGNSSSSLSIAGQHFFFNNVRNESFNQDRSPDLIRSVGNVDKAKMNMFFGSINADKLFDSKNYAAVNVRFVSHPMKTRGTLSGLIENPLTKEEMPLTGTTRSDQSFKNLQTQLYYKHNFSASHLIEATGYYSFSKSGSNAFREEINEWYPYEMSMDFHNKDNNFGLEIDYSIFFENVGTFEAGSKTDFQKISIDDLKDDFPVYDYEEFKEYIFAGLNNNRLQRKFGYNISLGTNIVSINADGSKNTYVDLIPSVSLGYRFKPAHYLSFRYYRNRTMPTPAQLNPRNLSTNEFVVNKGNPNLRPSHMDVFTLGYTFTKNKWRVYPYLQYYHVSDLITVDGSLNGNIYTTTYQNCDYMDGYQCGASINYNTNFGFLGASVGYVKTVIPDMIFSGEGITTSINGNARINRVSMNLYFG